MTWEITSQMIGLLVSTGLTLILLFALYYFVFSKQKEGEAPVNKLMVFLEVYYEGFRKLIRSLSGGAHEWSHIYLFTLFNFIFINSLMPWIGLEAAPSTLMFTFPLALLSFIGIFIIGIGTLGLWGFVKHKYANPMEIVMQFAPLISMSVRLFGATFAGAVIGNVPWIIMNGVTSGQGAISDISAWTPVAQAFLMFAWKIADTMLSLIQAFVFMTLTIIFWCADTGPSWSPKERKAIKEAKKKEKLRMGESTAEIDLTDLKSEMIEQTELTVNNNQPMNESEKIQEEVQNE